MAKRIVALFADGGLIGRNPSEVGGTWAWCATDAQGNRVREVSGYVLPVEHASPGWPRVECPGVTNNMVEFFAVLRALENMPRGWSGYVASDSKVTLRRFGWIDRYAIANLPITWQQRGKAALQRLGPLKWVHLAGHPTREELLNGYAVRDGKRYRVSQHQVWCDEACTERSRNYQLYLCEEPDVTPLLERLGLVAPEEAIAA
jgi:hypothetical protein